MYFSMEFLSAHAIADGRQRRCQLANTAVAWCLEVPFHLHNGATQRGHMYSLHPLVEV